MYSIRHLLHIDAPEDRVYEALTTISGLAGWWTVQTTGNADPGGIIDFRFGNRYHMQMEVLECVKDKKVLWKCIQAEPDWIGTTISFELDRHEGKTQLRFKHDKWPTHGDFFAHCNLSWARYLLSLRSLIETGKGQPFAP